MKRIIQINILLITLVLFAAVSLTGCQKEAIANPAAALTQAEKTIAPIETEAVASLMAIAVSSQDNNALAAQPTPLPTLEPTPSPTPKPTVKPKPTATPKPTPKPKITKLEKRQGTIKGENVLLRKEPSTTAKKLDWLTTGDIVMVTGKTGEFYQVTHGGKAGFISKKLVKLASFNEKELYLAAQLVTAEGRGQSVKGYETMVQVVYNRVRSRKFPNTIEGVAFQKGQFSVTHNKAWFLSIKPTSRAKNAVREIFVKGKRVIPTDVMFFKSTRLAKEWGSRKYYCTLDGTMYYR